MNEKKDGPTIIKHPPHSWWKGDERVEKFMPPVRDAIMRHLPWPSPEFTDIYNRAYEAVCNAIIEYDKAIANEPVITNTKKRKRSHAKHNN